MARIASLQKSTEEYPGTSRIGLTEHVHDPNETSRDQLSTYPSKNPNSLAMEGPLHIYQDGPIGVESDDSPDRLSGHDTTPGARNTKTTLSPLSTKSSVYMWTVSLSALIPVAALVIWLLFASERGRIPTSLSGSEIGGHLTQTQAKEIDFVCSALLSPLLFAGLNLLWFACARVCVINESTRSVSLQTLVTASAMSRGTYDPFQYYALLRGRSWKLAALGGIAFCSALGSSALGNMIAYEVFNEVRTSNNDFNLRLLYDAIIESTTPQESILPQLSGITLSSIDEPPPSYDFSHSDFATVAQTATDILYGLEFISGTLDEYHGYIGVNATSASMSSLDKSISTLINVPGFRLSAECAPSEVNSVEVLTLANEYVVIIPNITYHAKLPGVEVSQELDSCVASYLYLGGQEELTTSSTSGYAFPAWGIRGCGYTFNLIYTMSGIHSQVLISSYGDLQPTHQYKAKGENYTEVLAPATFWGLQCVLLQQQGLINYTRSADTQWSVAATFFDERKSAISSQLKNWQRPVPGSGWTPPQLGVVLFGRDPLKPCSGVTNKCIPTRNVSDSVGDYIYASGEITRIIYNAAAADPSRAAGHPEYYQNVTGTVNKQYYRITYVPILLLLALVSIILAALLTIALMISASKTASWAWFRQVEIVRLVVDAVGGPLRHQDEQQFAKLSGASDNEIVSWAQEYRLEYVKVVEDQSQKQKEFGHVQPVSVQLVQKTKPRMP